MGLFSDYIDFVRGSYSEYDQAIQEQDLGVGADYEAFTGEPFGPHVVGAGVIGFASGTLWAGPAAHLTYHAFERLYQGIVDYGSIDTIVIDGGIVLPPLREWEGRPSVLTDSIVGKSVQQNKTSPSRARSRCTWKKGGRRCSRTQWHTGAHRF